MRPAVRPARLPGPRPGPPHHVPGFSLIEVLLALALGLLLVGSVVSGVIAHIGEQRRLLAQARLSQDLRAVMDLASRDLRRAGHWGLAERGAPAEPGRLPEPNPYTGLHPAAGATAAAVGHAYSRDAEENGVVDANERFGLRLNGNTGALEWRVSGAALAPGSGDQWQAVTDPALLRVTELEIRHEADRVDLLAQCPSDHCADPADPDCPPRLLIHRVTLTIEASDVRDPTVRRRLRNTLRLRNEELQGACPAL